jgi:tetratricopeptide (TPR) repeat protein
MRAQRSTQLAGILGFCLLGAPLFRLTAGRCPADGRRGLAVPIRPAGSVSPSRAARSEGWRYWQQAELAVNQDREDLLAWDPQASGTRGEEVWRRQLMARDRTGDLRRARAAAQRADALAQSREEAAEAALLRLRIECDLGDHEAELRLARRLIALEPNTQRAQRALQCALTRAGRAPLATATRDVRSEGGAQLMSPGR